jgi:hypothetical protein
VGLQTEKSQYRDHTFQSAIQSVPVRRPHHQTPAQERSETRESNAKGILAVPTRTLATARARMLGGNRSLILLKASRRRTIRRAASLRGTLFQITEFSDRESIVSARAVTHYRVQRQQTCASHRAHHLSTPSSGGRSCLRNSSTRRARYGGRGEASGDKSCCNL